MSQVIENVCIVTDGKSELAIEALTDRVIIREDKFKSGYECSTCEGEGYLEEDCSFCKGTGKENISTPEETLCRMCCPRALQQSDVGVRPGKKLCENCNGTGGVLVAPQISQKRPTTGVVQSVGPDVKNIKVGDHVLYSMFAGTAINFRQKQVIRIMFEHEIYSRIYGAGKLGEWMR